MKQKMIVLLITYPFENILLGEEYIQKNVKENKRKIKEIK